MPGQSARSFDQQGEKAMTKYLHYTDRVEAPLGAASVILNKTEAILSFQELAHFASSGTFEPLGGTLHRSFKDMDMVEVARDILRVRLPSGDREVRVSYSDFARVFNQTAEGGTIDISSLAAPDRKT